MNFLKIFFEFLKIGGFSFGGGMSTLPYIYEMSQTTSWISKNEINNILAVSQITPGPFACNIGTVVGIKVGGIWGAIIANISFVIPAICFMGISYKFYNIIQKNNKAMEIIKIVRASALAILITSSITIFKGAFLNEIESSNINVLDSINYKAIILGIILYFFQKKTKLNSLVFIIFSTIIAGILGI